jgi:hypothetical protein
MSDKNQSLSLIRSGILPCMGILFVILLSAGCSGAFSGIQNTVPATPVSSGTVMNQTPDTSTFDHQITMQVIMVDEHADADYTTVWLTPSERIYKLAKNIPDYKSYIALMEQSRKDGSLLTFTLDTQDSSIITSVVKGVQPTSSSNEEKAAQVTPPVSSPDVANQANQITMQVILVDEHADPEYTTVWLTPSERMYKLAKNIPDYQTYIGLMEQSRKDGSLLTFTLASDDPAIIKSINT